MRRGDLSALPTRRPYPRLLRRGEMGVERGRVGDELGARRGVGDRAAVERRRHRADCEERDAARAPEETPNANVPPRPRFPRYIVHPRRYVEFAASPRISNSVGPGYCSRSSRLSGGSRTPSRE